MISLGLYFVNTIFIYFICFFIIDNVICCCQNVLIICRLYFSFYYCLFQNNHVNCYRKVLHYEAEIIIGNKLSMKGEFIYGRFFWRYLKIRLCP